MSTEFKPIKVYGKGGPNPPKVTMLLKELEIPHEIIPIGFADVKKPDFLAINPNGRMPAIYDPNTGLTLWESGAIFLYLIERYDPERKLSFEPGSSESHHASQWLFYQVSGQGPYYGQANWFKSLHPEPVPSALERYTKEIARVTAVLEGHLKKQKEKYGEGDGPWLVGGKMSYADIAFMSWQWIFSRILTFEKDFYNPDDFPEVREWLDRMYARPAVKQVVDEQIEAGR
jgi:glutathione S-transferase